MWHGRGFVPTEIVRPTSETALYLRVGAILLVQLGTKLTRNDFIRPTFYLYKLLRASDFLTIENKNMV